MSLPVYQVHYPKIGKITIKIGNVIMKYNHNDIVSEQAFFSKYPHIFKPRPDLQNLDFNVDVPKEKQIQRDEEFVPVQVNSVQEVPEVQEVQTEPEELPVPTPSDIQEIEHIEVEQIQEVPALEDDEYDVEMFKEILTIEKAGKGWYKVVNEIGYQVYPIDTSKKCRKKAAQKFISLQSEREEDES